MKSEREPEKKMKKHLPSFILLLLLPLCSHKLEEKPSEIWVQSFRDPEDLPFVVGRLTGAYLLELGDAWADHEIADTGIFDWKDVLAGLWLTLRQYYQLDENEIAVVEKDVDLVLKETKHQKLQKEKKK